eukprot:403354238
MHGLRIFNCAAQQNGVNCFGTYPKILDLGALANPQINTFDVVRGQGLTTAFERILIAGQKDSESGFIAIIDENINLKDAIQVNDGLITTLKLSTSGGFLYLAGQINTSPHPQLLFISYYIESDYPLWAQYYQSPTYRSADYLVTVMDVVGLMPSIPGIIETYDSILMIAQQPMTDEFEIIWTQTNTTGDAADKLATFNKYHEIKSLLNFPQLYVIGVQAVDAGEFYGLFRDYISQKSIVIEVKRYSTGSKFYINYAFVDYQLYDNVPSNKIFTNALRSFSVGKSLSFDQKVFNHQVIYLIDEDYSLYCDRYNQEPDFLTVKNASQQIKYFEYNNYDNSQNDQITTMDMPYNIQASNPNMPLISAGFQKLCVYPELNQQSNIVSDQLPPDNPFIRTQNQIQEATTFSFDLFSNCANKDIEWSLVFNNTNGEAVLEMAQFGTNECYNSTNCAHVFSYKKLANDAKIDLYDFNVRIYDQKMELYSKKYSIFIDVKENKNVPYIQIPISNEDQAKEDLLKKQSDSVTCEINSEDIQVEFRDPTFFMALETDFSEFLYENSQLIQGVLMAAVGSNFAMNLALSGSLQYFWGMINALIIISHLPLFELNFPENAKLLFAIIVQVSSMDMFNTEEIYASLIKFDFTEIPLLGSSRWSNLTFVWIFEAEIQIFQTDKVRKA